MKLIGISILIGVIVAWVGGILWGESYMFLLGIVGFLSPSLYVLEQIYEEMKKSK